MKEENFRYTIEDNSNTEDRSYLSKPTTTISSPTAVVKYVILVDEQGNTQRMLAEDLGKNMANSRLTTTTEGSITQGANYTWNTAGYHFYLTGLPNKSADPTFNLMMVQDANGQNAVSNGKAVLENLMASLPSIRNEYTGKYDADFYIYPVYNPVTKKIAFSDKPQIVSNFNVPTQININYPTTIANSNYTPSPTTPQDIRDTFEMIKRLENGYNFTLITPGMWINKQMSQSKISPYSSWIMPDMSSVNNTTKDGTLNIVKDVTPPRELIFNTDFLNSVSNENTMWAIILNKEFPSNKDWILRINSHIASTGDYRWQLLAYHTFIGFIDNPNNYNIRPQKDFSNQVEVTNNHIQIREVDFLTMYFIKKGSKLTFLIHNYFNGEIKTRTIDYDNSMKYLRFGHLIYSNKDYETRPQIVKAYLRDIGYWIQP